MKDYYNIRQAYGNHKVLHGLRSHPTILEWLHILHTKYHRLDEREILNYEIEIGNWISGDCHWDTVYKTSYNPTNKCITVTGFPKYGYPDYFKVNDAQLEFLLHRMRYNKATVYYNHRSVLKIVLCITKEYPFDTKKVFHVQVADNEIDDYCNILTPHTPRKWEGGKECPKKKHKHHHHHHQQQTQTQPTQPTQPTENPTPSNNTTDTDTTDTTDTTTTPNP